MKLQPLLFFILIMVSASLHLKVGVKQLDMLDKSLIYFFKIDQSNNSIHEKQSKQNSFKPIEFTTHSFLQSQIINACKPISTANFSQMTLYQPNSAYFHSNLSSCLDYSDLKYVRIQISRQIFCPQHYFGICLPQECKKETIINTTNQFLNKNQLNNSIFNYTQTYTVPSYSITWETVITLLIICLLVVLCVISTLDDRNDRQGFMYAFNLRNNSLLKENTDNRLKILDGLRAISFLMIIIAHFFAYQLKFEPTNFNSNIKIFSSYFVLLLQFPYISVDLFLFLSGSMLGIYLIKQQNISIKQIFLIILNRWFRVIPSYLLSMLIYSSVIVHTGSGPLWDHLQQLTRPCCHLWQQLLFVSNIINKMANICMGWTWYLQVDLQLFVWCLGIFYIYQQNKRLAIIFALTFNIIALVFQYINALENKVTIIYNVDSLFSKFLYMNQYIKPWNNITSYQLGFFFGIIYSEYSKQKQKRQQLVLVQQQANSFLLEMEYKCLSIPNFQDYFFITGICVLILILLIPSTLLFGIEWPFEIHALYVISYRVVGVLGINIMILPTLLGFKDNLINHFLSCNLLQFISKISFSGYLLHLMIIFRMAYSIKYDYTFSFHITFVLMLSAIVQIMIVGTIFYMIVEYPIMSIQNKLMKQQSGMAKQNSLSIQIKKQ